jgi:hypothetical protein
VWQVTRAVILRPRSLAELSPKYLFGALSQVGFAAGEAADERFPCRSELEFVALLLM